MSLPSDSIAAIATATGRGGVGIVRVSGPLAAPLARAICGRELPPRHAHYGNFLDGCPDHDTATSASMSTFVGAMAGTAVSEERV